MSAVPIPQELIFAFEQAVVALQDWRFRGEEPSIGIRSTMFTRSYSIGEICALVESFIDVMPDRVSAKLWELADQYNTDGPAGTSYGDGAKSLRAAYKKKLDREKRLRGA